MLVFYQNRRGFINTDSLYIEYPQSNYKKAMGVNAEIHGDKGVLLGTFINTARAELVVQEAYQAALTGKPYRIPEEGEY